VASSFAFAISSSVGTFDFNFIVVCVALLDAWKLWHSDNARLIATCAAANRSKGVSYPEAPQNVIGSFAKEDDEDIDLEF